MAGKGLSVVSVIQQVSTGVNDRLLMANQYMRKDLAIASHFCSVSCLLYPPTLLKASCSSTISSSEKCAVDAISYFFEWQVCKKKALGFIWCLLGFIVVMKKRGFQLDFQSLGAAPHS